MKYYKKIEGKDKITCMLCRHYCKLKEGQSGICGVNKNEKYKLKNLVYGHPVAINVDPIEKKPLYHMIPGSNVLSFGTVGCNFKCPFCQNWDISQEKIINKQIYVTPEQMVELALEQHASGIAYTYNEPTVFYPYAKDIGLLAKAKGLKNIFVSNGFESKEIIDDMASWVDAANIDLKSWDNEYYKKVLKGGLEEVKDSIIRMKNAGIWVEVTTLIISHENDSNHTLKAMANFIANKLGKDVPWHLSAFFPNYKMQEHEITNIQTLQKAKDIAKEVGLKYVYIGNTSQKSHTYCPKCKEMLIDRTVYTVKEKQLKNGYCSSCNHKIEGIWS